jgi:hypothetical protein
LLHLAGGTRTAAPPPARTLIGTCSNTIRSSAGTATCCSAAAAVCSAVPPSDSGRSKAGRRGAKSTPSRLRPSRSVAELSSPTEAHWRLESPQVLGVVVLHPSRSLAGARASARTARAAPLNFSPLMTSIPRADLWFLNRLRGFQPALSMAGTRGLAAR